MREAHERRQRLAHRLVAAASARVGNQSESRTWELFMRPLPQKEIQRANRSHQRGAWLLEFRRSARVTRVSCQRCGESMRELRSDGSLESLEEISCVASCRFSASLPFSGPCSLPLPLASTICRSSLPANIGAGMLQQEMIRCSQRSETFRQQCRRIAAAPYVRMVRARFEVTGRRGPDRHRSLPGRRHRRPRDDARRGGLLGAHSARTRAHHRAVEGVRLSEERSPAGVDRVERRLRDPAGHRRRR